MGGQEDSRVSCFNGDVTGGRYFVCAFDKSQTVTAGLFPEKIIQFASVFSAVVKRLSLHLRGKYCICDFYADKYVEWFSKYRLVQYG